MALVFHLTIHYAQFCTRSSPSYQTEFYITSPQPAGKGKFAIFVLATSIQIHAIICNNMLSFEFERTLGYLYYIYIYKQCFVFYQLVIYLDVRPTKFCQSMRTSTEHMNENTIFLLFLVCFFNVLCSYSGYFYFISNSLRCLLFFYRYTYIMTISFYMINHLLLLFSIVACHHFMFYLFYTMM